jgi:hypothetical protein
VKNDENILAKILCTESKATFELDFEECFAVNVLSDEIRPMPVVTQPHGDETIVC